MARTARGWKRAEQMFAEDVDTKRIPVLGEDRDGADFRADGVAYQLKVRAGMPAYLVAWLEGLRAVAKIAGDLAAVVWARPNCRRDDALVVIRWSDWRDRVLPAMRAADAYEREFGEADRRIARRLLEAGGAGDARSGVD